MDVSTVGDFENSCAKLIQDRTTAMVLDLSALDYISSAGLRAILGVEKKLKFQNGKLVLCGLRGMVKEVFQISGFAVLFPVCATAEAALEQCR
jgi:anti-anti-sigma factor